MYYAALQQYRLSMQGPSRMVPTWEVRMFDAEIATTLLNRWERIQRTEGASALELLREGKLAFSHHVGTIARVNDADDGSAIDIELLTFDDGSTALRLSAGTRLAGWTRWVPIDPVSEENEAVESENLRSRVATHQNDLQS
jgi:hypothetical protein